MAEKYAKQLQPAVSASYVVSSDWKICRRLCVSINGPGEFDFCPWKWYASRIEGGEPSFRIWARYAFGFSSYSLCTRRTDRQTGRTDRQKQSLLPLSYWWGHNNRHKPFNLPSFSLAPTTHALPAKIAFEVLLITHLLTPCFGAYSLFLSLGSEDVC